jgi:hypothetical protein
MSHRVTQRTFDVIPSLNPPFQGFRQGGIGTVVSWSSLEHDGGALWEA